MPSRLNAIAVAVQAHVLTAFPTATISFEPAAFDTTPTTDYPLAMLLFIESEPERLDFKQERRRVTGQVAIGVLPAAGTSQAATREIVDLGLEVLRDALFADETLTSTVDDVSCEIGRAYSSADDPVVYGTLDIITEELF